MSVLLAASLPLTMLAAALAGLLMPLRWRQGAAVLAVAAAAVTLLAAVCLAFLAQGAPSGRYGHAGSFQLVDFGGIAVTVGVRVTPVVALVAVAVAAVAAAVQVYSVSYLRAWPGAPEQTPSDERYPPYAAQVSLFTAAMLTVVVASDLVQLLVGWEVMGICSYLLIAHDRRLPEAPAAAVKAFLVTRVGDVGFWLGIALLGLQVGSFRIDRVLDAAVNGEISVGVATTACLLLLAGVVGKSAQFPLHTWLPDAMAGPTPISALIHAATMVASGVYVVGQLLPLYAAAPVALAVFAVIAAITMLLGAFAATAQDDMKRVLAWSTVSQIGYMAGALAVGSVSASTFHLLSHAAFKALLFLAAGAVIHAVGSNLLSAMGGARDGAPATYWTMTIGLAALVGAPLFSGFFSKESVLGAAAEAAWGHGPQTCCTAGHSGELIHFAPAEWTGWLVLLSGLATVAVTGWYATRLWLRTFFGARRADFRPHDPPPLMRWPLIALAGPSALLGAAVVAWPWPGARFPAFDLGLTVLTTALAGVGVGGAWLAWRRDIAADPAWAWGPLRPVFAQAFYLDQLQRAAVVRPVTALARAVRRADEQLVDGAVEGAGTGALGLGKLVGAAHAKGLPRYATATLAGAVLIGAAAVLTGVLR
ncbi:MAG: NADH-quinone oxidoreductase subunit 5 family protein [Micromonosporaceae bacterium]